LEYLLSSTRAHTSMHLSFLKGGATNNHTGNVSYRLLVHEHQDEYLHAVKASKKEVARSIVATIRSRGGGFLRKCTDGRVGWIDVGDKKAREKTSQALREGLDAKTLLTKGINKADILSDLAAASEGPPPKRRRRSSDADVASSEARNHHYHQQQQQQQQHFKAEAATDAGTVHVAATVAADDDPANKATASPELVAEAAPTYWDYGDMFSFNGPCGVLPGYYRYASAYPSGGYYLGGSFYAAAAEAIPGVTGLDYGTDETDLYASGAQEFDVPPPPTAADCTDTAQV